MIFFSMLINNMVNGFNKINSFALLTCFITWLYGFKQMLLIKIFLFTYMIILFYEYIKKIYCEIKNIIKNIIEIEKIKNENDREIENIKSVYLNIKTIEDFCMNTKINTIKLLNEHNNSLCNSEIYKDSKKINYVIVNSALFLYDLLYQIIESYFCIIEELPYFNNIKDNYLIIKKIYDYETQNNKINLNNLDKTDDVNTDSLNLLSQLNEMNNMINAMEPILKMQNNFNNKMDTQINDKQIDNIMKNLFSNVIIDQQQIKKKPLTKKKKDNK